MSKPFARFFALMAAIAAGEIDRLAAVYRSRGKGRGGRVAKSRLGNKPGRSYFVAPGSGEREKARRVRQMARGAAL